jgi:hypothetical protein
VRSIEPLWNATKNLASWALGAGVAALSVVLTTQQVNHGLDHARGLP